MKQEGDKKCVVGMKRGVKQREELRPKRAGRPKRGPEVGQWEAEAECELRPKQGGRPQGGKLRLKKWGS